MVNTVLSNSANKEQPQEIKLKWLDSGKPIVEGWEGESVGVSFSHDDHFCLCVAGYGSQGCDIVPVTHRLQEDWTILLTNHRKPLMQKLVASKDSVDKAGTRIWAAVEAARKATNVADIDLAVARQEEDSVLFVGTVNHIKIYILTFSLMLTQGSEKMIAITVSPIESSKCISQSLLDTLNFDLENTTVSRLKDLDYNNTFYRFNLAKENKKIVVLRWPVSYIEASNPSKSLYFSNYLTWMNKVRDLAIWPIRTPMEEYLATGKWGMVTNSAQIQIFGEAKTHNVIEVHFWVSRISGSANSTVDFNYDWCKVLPNGNLERIAFSKLSMTLVQIAGNGATKPKPLLDFLDHFFNQICNPDYAPQLSQGLCKDIDMGKELYSVPNRPKSGIVLREQSFETSLEDTDAVGNINFAHYYVLQGRLRDNFFYNLIPNHYSRAKSKKQTLGEFRCLFSKVEHLREAMPFEKMQVTMSLRKVYSNGIDLAFEYFCLNSDGDKQKIAIGEHSVVWLACRQKGINHPAKLPPEILKSLLENSEIAKL
jgi:enediyne polyketide synthase